MIVSRDIESPRGGWKLTVEQTGVTITAPFYAVLRRKVRSHMLANSIPLPDDFDAWCEDAACRESGHGRPFCGEAEAVRPEGMLPHLNMAMAKKFISTMVRVVKERRFVSREEAERRAAICRSCPLATSIGGCMGGCSAVFRTMERALKHDPIEMPKSQEFCGACGCVLRLKVLIPNDILDSAETTRPPYWEGCWRNAATPTGDETQSV